MKSIGKDVVLMLPTAESCSKLGPDKIIIVLPIDALKWKKGKGENYSTRYLSSECCKGIELEKVVIPNSGFTISLFPNYEESGYHYYAKSYCDTHLVKLSHPALKKYPFTIATYVYSRDLINIIAKSRNILDGELSGNFCCIHESGTSGIYYTKFDAEDPSDDKMENEKNIGKLISEGKRTTKWKVGYQYITKSERMFIYLGDIAGGWLKPTYGSGFGDCLPTGFNNSVSEVQDTLALILDVTDLDKDSKDLIDSSKNGWSSIFIVTYLSYIVLNNISNYRNRLRTIKKSSHPAIELGKVFEGDNKNVKDLILDFYTSRFPRVTDHELLVRYENLSDANKEIMDNKIAKIITEYVNRNRKSAYRSSSALDLSTAQDPNKLVQFIKSDVTAYRFFNDEVFGALKYIGEEDFKRIAKTCTFS